MSVIIALVFLRVLLTDTVLMSKFESLSYIYSNYSESPGIDHYTKYGPAYDENIYHLREKALSEGRKVKVLEIGVQSGGSTRAWKRYFRGTLDYTGLDIDPRCKMFESPKEGIRIVIGSQLHTQVLSDLCKKYGPFDLVVDDGGHTNKMMLTSLNSLWSCMKDDGVYVIEDLHALNMWHSTSIEGTLFKEMSLWMKRRSPWPTSGKSINHQSSHLQKLEFYDSILFLHYSDKVPELGRFKTGEHWLEGSRTSNEAPSNLTLKDWCKKCCIGCYDD